MRILVLILALLQLPEDIYKTATADLDAGRWSDAAAKFELILKDDPAHIPTRFSLAVCYTKIGNADGAVSQYRKILELDETIYEARNNLAILLDQTGQRSAAAEQLEKLAVMRPDDPQAQFRLGMFYARGDELEKAYPYLVAASGKDLEYPELYIALSEAEHLRKDDGKSRTYLEKAYQLDPSNKNVQRQLGIIYREAHEYGKAIELLKPLLPESRQELALSYFDNKNYREAVPLLVELINADGSNPNVDYLYMLGKSYLEVMAYPQAVAVLQRVLQVKPDYVEAYGTLGSVYFIQEDWARAAQMLTRFVEFKPTQAIAHFALGACLDKLGNFKEALVHYNKFLEFDDGSNDPRSFQTRQRVKTLERRLKK
jgi:tetratricopeptide (TPR) repeat protein